MDLKPAPKRRSHIWHCAAGQKPVTEEATGPTGDATALLLSINVISLPNCLRAPLLSILIVEGNSTRLVFTQRLMVVRWQKLR